MRKFQIYQDEVGSKGMSFHPHSLVLTHLNLCEQEAKNIPFDLYDQVKTANKADIRVALLDTTTASNSRLICSTSNLR